MMQRVNFFLLILTVVAVLGVSVQMAVTQRANTLALQQLLHVEMRASLDDAMAGRRDEVLGAPASPQLADRLAEAEAGAQAVRDRAETDQAATRAIIAFLAGTLAAGETGTAGIDAGEQIRTMLSIAADRIDRDFGANPQVASRLHVALEATGLMASSSGNTPE